MTMIGSRKVTCAVCGFESDQESLASSNQVGSELDGRPIGMYRSTMDCWAQQCPNPDCGYCASSIGEDLAHAAECVKSKEYGDALKQDDLPVLMRRFRCAALTALWAKNLSLSATFFLYAAWVADDAKLADKAKLMRVMASNLFHESQGCGCLLVDVLRRAERFDQAASALERCLGQAGISKEAAALLNYQRRLIERKDSAAHSAEEAFTP